MNDINLNYYTEASQISSVEGYEKYLEEIPDRIELIIQIIQGLLIHDSWLEIYGTNEINENIPNTSLLTVRDIFNTIVNIDKKSFLIPRGIEKRAIVCCRDFSLVLCSILRFKKIPCRLRVGFASYLAPPNLFEDHWVCEYWNSKEKKWKRIDPQVDLFQHKMIREWTKHYDNLEYKEMIYDFDNLNLKNCDFYSAGRIWNKVRNKETDAKQYGLCFDPDSFGIDFIKANLLRDFACLNKEEPRINYLKNTALWDKWHLSNKPIKKMTSDELNLINDIAELTLQNEIKVNIINDFYLKNENIQIPRAE